MVWGEKIQKILDNEFKLNHKTHKAGLILKHLPPTSVVISEPPQDIGPFLGAHFISDLPFYSSVALHFAQDMIKVGHWVKVVNGEQKGLIGDVIDISDGTAKVILHNNNETPLLISLYVLFNPYLPSDHIKYQYDDKNEHGIVSVVQQDAKKLTFVENDTYMVVRIIQLTQHMLIYLARSLHTWMLWSHGPPLPTFIISHWGYGLGSQVQLILGDSSITDTLQRWRVVSLLLWMRSMRCDMFAEVSNKLSSVELANIRSKFDINRAELEVAAS